MRFFYSADGRKVGYKIDEPSDLVRDRNFN